MELVNETNKFTLSKKRNLKKKSFTFPDSRKILRLKSHTFAKL